MGKVIGKYYPSLEQALKMTYHEYPWNSLLFVHKKSKKPRDHWKITSNLIKELDGVEDKLGIKQVSVVDLRSAC